jgi:hypothetical protein
VLVSACLPSAGIGPLVDDRDPAFRRMGSGWEEGAGGYAGSHARVLAQASTRVRYGAWRPLLEAGDHEILVSIPPGDDWTRHATYRIRDASGWVSRVRSQAKWQGAWLSLGIHRLTESPIVQLADVTGESSGLGRQVAFDAVRFVPTAGATGEH